MIKNNTGRTGKGFFVLIFLFVMSFAGATDLSISPSSKQVAVGETFLININISDVLELYSYQLDLTYDPVILRYNSISVGPFLSSDGAQVFPIMPNSTRVPGLLDNFAATRVNILSGVSGNGLAGTINFTALSAGTSNLVILNDVLYDSNESSPQLISHTTNSGSVTVTSGITCTDADGDGYGVCPNCGTSVGCTYDGNDCDDNPVTGFAINPGAVENCLDGVDNNCNGESDYDLGTDLLRGDSACSLSFHVPGIATGIPTSPFVGENSLFTLRCLIDPLSSPYDSIYATFGGTACTFLQYQTLAHYFTCNSGVYTGSNKTATCYINNSKSYVSGATSASMEYSVTQSCVDSDGDGYSVTGGACGPVDCDDTPVSGFNVNPGAMEICDGIDNDCNAGTADGTGECGGSTPFCDGSNCVECIGNSDCLDSIACDGIEICSLGVCIEGTPIDCSDYSEISTCTYIPDGIGTTYDFRAFFDSVCQEPLGGCSVIPDPTITHTCNTICGAECLDSSDCTATDCDTLDTCVGNDYHDYVDVPNTCEGDCGCTDNVCGASTIYTNDVRCTQCQVDDDCNNLDSDYCDGDAVMHSEGRCVNFACQTETTETQNCDAQDSTYCSGTQVWNDDYTCNLASCILNSQTMMQECNNGLVCDGVESCSSGSCVDAPNVDCSSRNIVGVAQCLFNPDGISTTWDFRSEFISACQEPSGGCSQGSTDVTSTCDFACNAECEINADCLPTDCDSLDGCQGPDYYNYADVSNTCNGTCGCTDNVCGSPAITYDDPVCTGLCVDNEDCNGLDQNYCSGNLVLHDEGVCNVGVCGVQTTTTQNCDDGIACTTNTCNGFLVQCEYLPDNSYCNNGLVCDGVETCNALIGCTNPPDVVCSDYSEISTCFNVPEDGIDTTYDFRAFFDSVCLEPSGGCSVISDPTITHTCNTTCGAGCVDSLDCVATSCGSDRCIGNDWYDYTDKPNTCDGCSCTSNICDEPVVTPNHPSCVDCTQDSNCTYLNSMTCSGDLVINNTGVCSPLTFTCELSSSQSQDCDSMDSNLCSGTDILFEDYTCNLGSCILLSSNVVQDCVDSFSCTDDSCVPGVTPSCSNSPNDALCNVGIGEFCNPLQFPAPTGCGSDCVDADGDGYDTCPVGTSGGDVNEIDCDDTPVTGFDINPGATEVCGDAIDNNCMGGIDEGCSLGCTITDISWSINYVNEDDVVSLIVNGTNCDGVSVNFGVWEKDGFVEDAIGGGDDAVDRNPDSVVFSGGVAVGQWQAEWHDDGFLTLAGDPEYYFNAEVDGVTYNSGFSQSDLLVVNLTGRNYETMNIPLNAGKNAFSLPLILDNMSIDKVFEDIAPSVDRIYTYEGNFKVRHFNNNRPGNLQNLETGRGYIVFMNADAVLTINGTTRDVNLQRPTIHLAHGWNLIGTFSGAYRTSDILSGLDYSRLHVYNEVTGKFDSIVGNPILERDKSYWINVDTEANFIPLTGEVVENENE